MTGDTSDATSDLAQLSGELEAFNRQQAEAELTIDDSQFDREIAEARAQLAALDRQDVSIDVDARGLKGLGRDAHAAGGGMRVFGSALRTVIRLLPALPALVSAVVVPMLALASSLASAGLGLGALGIALGTTLPPLVALAIGAVRRFKDQSDKAGTAANKLKQAGSELADVFDQTLAPGIDKIFKALADIAPDLGDAFGTLKDDFKDLGGAFAEFIRETADFATSKDSVKAMETAIKTLADLVRGSGGEALRSLARLLGNIAEAASPLLVKAFDSIAASLKDTAQRTSDISALRETIRGQFQDLRDWANLLSEAGRALKNLFSAALPDGRELVDLLTKGATKLADWLGSTEGEERVREFFAAIIPVAKEIGRVLGKLGEAFIHWSELTAPVIRPILQLVGKVLDAVNDLLGALKKLPEPLDTIAGGLLLFGSAKILGGIGGLKSALSKLAPMLLKLGGPLGLVVGLGIALNEAFPASQNEAIREYAAKVKNLQATMAELVATKIGNWADQGKLAFLSFFNTLRDGGKDAKETAKNVGTDMVTVLKGLTGNFKGVGEDLIGRFTDGAKSKEGSAKNAASDIGQAGKRVLGDFRGDFRGVGENLIDAFSGGKRSKEGAAKNASFDVGQAGKAAINAFQGDFRGAGENLIEALSGGQRSKEGSAKNASFDVGRAAKNALEGFREQFFGEGETHGDRLAGGLGSKDKAAGNAGGSLARAAKAALDGVSLSPTGKSIGQSLADGLLLALDAVKNAVASLVAAAINAANSNGGGNGNNKLGTSNKVAAETGGALTDHFSRALTTGLTAAIAGSRLQLTAGVVGIAVPAGAPIFHQAFNINAPAGHSPDPRATAAMLAAEMRARGGLG